MGDDTMTPDCLETMVHALERTPKAGIAHCNLVFINDRGEPTDDKWEDMQKIKYYGPWVERTHIRIAPYDAVLYCVLGTMYTSLTQLLIRRSVFAQVGNFATGFGSAGDFEWGLRAAWLVSTVHVPHALAAWRIHTAQATKDSFVFSAAGRRKRCVMITAARRYLARMPNSGRLPRARLLSSHYRLEQLLFELEETESRLRRGWILLGTLFTHPWVGSTYVLSRVTGERQLGKDAVIRRLFTALHLNPAELLVAIPEDGGKAK